MSIKRTIVSSAYEADELNLALAISRSEHEARLAKEAKKAEEYRRRPLKSLQVQNQLLSISPNEYHFSNQGHSHLLSVPSPNYRIAEQPPRYSSLYGRQDPPSAFYYKSPKSAVGMKSARIEPTTPTSPTPDVPTALKPGFMTVRHGEQQPYFISNSYHLIQTPAPQVKFVQVPTYAAAQRPAAKSNGGGGGAFWCLCIIFTVVISLAVLMFLAVHFFIIPMWRHHDDHDDNDLGQGSSTSGFGQWWFTTRRPINTTTYRTSTYGSRLIFA